MSDGMLQPSSNGVSAGSAPVVVAADAIGKKYLIRHQQQGRYRTLSGDITKAGQRLARRIVGKRTAADLQGGWEEFWALRNLSFEVKQGEVVGIIGRNGAGKSTLLKLLSRITGPTEGRIRIRGRLASLLEVGTGFHPELTGRENIFLNGAVLGMSKKETLGKFDEIVEFAEAGTFLDTAVKYYSSGMYMRLAFSVAAHLEPEILVVDEVLAVGDIGFQKKCLGKMQGVAASGRTVLFVSHNMQAVRTLCSRCILLDKGRLILDSTPGACIERYNALSESSTFTAETAIWDHRFRRGSGTVRYSSIRVCNRHERDQYTFAPGETVRFILEYVAYDAVAGCTALVSIFCGRTGETVTSSRHLVNDAGMARQSRGRIVIEWDTTALRPGEYPLYFWLGDSRFLSYDTVDRLTAPLTIVSDKDSLELGYDPSQPSGYFSIDAALIESSELSTSKLSAKLPE